MGLDAETVRVIEGMRENGRTLTPGLYLRTALLQFYRVTDRRHPRLTLERDGQSPLEHLFLGIISNTSPWTYLGRAAGQSEPGREFRHRAGHLRAPANADDRHIERAPPDVHPA